MLTLTCCSYSSVRVSLWQEHMKEEEQLPSCLQTRVMNFFDYLWLRNKGADRQQELLADMPSCMQAELFLTITQQLIRHVRKTSFCTFYWFVMFCIHVGANIWISWCKHSLQPLSNDQTMSVPTWWVYCTWRRYWTWNVLYLSWNGELASTIDWTILCCSILYHRLRWSKGVVYSPSVRGTSLEWGSSSTSYPAVRCQSVPRHTVTSSHLVEKSLSIWCTPIIIME